MASISDGPFTPYLPPELYLAIAQRLQRTDLPHFRLASKILADAGRSEMFRTIILRCTYASWFAYKRVTEHEQISGLVRTLVLDVNSWRVGTDVRDWHEWTRYCESQANHHSQVNADPDQAALYKKLAESRHHWEAYLSRLQEEKTVGKEIASSMISEVPSSRLPNLRKVHIIRGAYQLKDHHVYRLQEQKKLPVTAPLEAWRGDSFSQALNAMKLVPLHRIIGTAPNVNKWRTDGFTVAEHSRLVGTCLRNLNLISFKMRFGTSDYSTAPGYFHQYLDQWPNLESLTLDLHSHITGRNSGTGTLQTIEDTFGVQDESAAVTSAPENPLTWQRLRKLYLGHFDTTPKALISLITRHGSTLRDLRLHAIWIRNKLFSSDKISAQHSWQEVFRSFRATTDLEHLVLSGIFRNGSIADDDWDFGVEGLGERVAGWILKGEQSSQSEELPLGLLTQGLKTD